VLNNNFPKRFIFVTVAIFALVSSACAADVTVLEPPTPTPTQMFIITATLPPTQTPLPSPTPEPATATPIPALAEGQTTSRLNVRSAPSADSEQIGTVENAVNLQIVGKDPTSGWWLIVYPESPTGMGWVAAQFVQVADPFDIPVINPQTPVAENAPIGEAAPGVETEAPGVPSQTPTPISAVAYPDGDSLQSPAVSMDLLRSSVRSFNYSSDLSIPDGDAEDWVQFTLVGNTGQQIMVSVVLDCSGNSALNVELIQNNALLQGWENITCGQRSQLQLYLYAGAPYNLRLFPAQENSSLNYVAYSVIVQLLR
jgi:hypothetical protein